MGVPKFFRYISERYPCLSELARESCIPEFDNLYLDMNGIIHNCTHPDDENVNFKMTEAEMFRDIFNYINKLFFLIKPQKVFFMAVDGVAPRAKMNQQRGRRFRSAKDAELLAKRAITRGESVQDERFDSNCITPGTEFMARLNEALRYMVKNKMNTDPLWRKCRVILSGQDVPGEGEHKIMDYIRYLKSQPDYNPNTRHCLYGLDADLIILGLCTHELHFVILREEVKFGKKTKRSSVEQTRFFLLHLGLFREYLEMEFDEIRQNDPNFDVANLIDDWVLMGFMVGNDFIPHLPCLHISTNALPILYKTYIKVYSELGGNINEAGKLNLPRLEKYFAALAEVEYDMYQENNADLKYFAEKKSKNGIDIAFDVDVSEIDNKNNDADFEEFIKQSNDFYGTEVDSDDEEKQILEEFENYKRNYYMSKLNEDVMSSEKKREQAICYITALQWVLDYYYRGVQSWNWFYPHHYAPFISDLKNFQDHKIEYKFGKPFLPFEQLLAVLPAASKSLLPPAYRDLMTSANSEIIDFYPETFSTDLNGKQHEWEAVVLIPFIDEALLLNTMKSCEENLTADEKRRNKHGPMLLYEFNEKSQGTAQGFYDFKTLHQVFCTETPIWTKDIAIPVDKTVCVELPNAARHVFFPGFPTMKHLKFNFEFKPFRVKVFDYPSRNENLILMPEKRTGFSDLLVVAEKYLNETIFIGWPHLIKAKVVGVSNAETYIEANGTSKNDSRTFQLQISSLQEHLLKRMGIEFSDYDVLVHVCVFTGASYVYQEKRIVTRYTWSNAITHYPAQGIVSEIAVQENYIKSYEKVEELFPKDSQVFFVGNSYNGSVGIVLDPMLVYKCGRIKVELTVQSEPDFSECHYIQSELERDYMSSYNAAAEVGVHIKCLAILTGSVFAVKGPKRSDLPENLSKINIGLQFKLPRQSEERSGYCRRIKMQWYFSTKAVQLIKDYYEKFPEVIEFLCRAPDRADYFFEYDIFPDCEETKEEKLDELNKWLKSQEHMKAETIPCESRTLEKETIEKLIQVIDDFKSNVPVRAIKLQVKPQLLIKPDVSSPDFYKSQNPIYLLDRVTIVRSTYMVPVGSTGTVIGIHPVSDPNPVRLECLRAVDYFYDILFDNILPNGNDIHGIAENRVYRVPENSLIVMFSQSNKKTDFAYRRQSDRQEQSYAAKLQDNKPIDSNQFPRISQQQQQQQPTNAPYINKGSDHFWTPSPNPPKVQRDIQQKAAKPAKTPQQPNPRNSQSNNNNNNADCVEKTQALKGLLGLMQNNSDNRPSTNAFVNNSQANFSLATDKPPLPAPPLCWRNTNTIQQQQQQQVFQPSVLQAPTPYVGTPYGFQPQYGMNSIQSPMQQQGRQMQQQPQLPSQAHPSNGFRSNSFTHQGAFIPMQVMSQNSTPSHQENRMQQMQSDMGKLNMNQTANNGTPSNVHRNNSNKPRRYNARPPRTPKIAARFDYQ